MLSAIAVICGGSALADLPLLAQQGIEQVRHGQVSRQVWVLDPIRGMTVCPIAVILGMSFGPSLHVLTTGPPRGRRAVRSSLADRSRQIDPGRSRRADRAGADVPGGMTPLVPAH
jgi:hypothetical protein